MYKNVKVGILKIRIAPEFWNFASTMTPSVGFKGGGRLKGRGHPHPPSMHTYMSTRDILPILES